MNKLLTMGILFIGLTTSTFAKSSTVNFNKSCRNFSIATFEMSEGTVKAFFRDGHKTYNRKTFKCTSDMKKFNFFSKMCTQSHFTNRHGLSYHKVVGTAKNIKNHRIRCK